MLDATAEPPPEDAALRRLGDGDACLGLERAAAGLLAAMVDRKKSQHAIETEIAARRSKAVSLHDRNLAAIRTRREQDLKSAQSLREAMVEMAHAERDDRQARIAEQLERKLDELQVIHDQDLARLRQKLEEAVLMAEAWREGGEESERRREREFNDALAKHLEECASLEARARAYLRSCRLSIPRDETVAPDTSDRKADQVIAERLVRAREHLDVILRTRAARLLSGYVPFVLGAAIIAGAAVIGGAVTLFDEAAWQITAIYSAIGAFAFVALTLGSLWFVAGRAMRRVWSPFQQDLAAIRAAKERAEREQEQRREETLGKLRAKEQAEEAQAHAKYDGPIADVPAALKRRTARTHASAQAEAKAAEEACAVKISEAEAAYASSIAAIEGSAAEAERAESARAMGEAEDIRAEEDRRRRELRESWLSVSTGMRDLLVSAVTIDRSWHLAWSAIDETRCIAPRRAPWFRFGGMTLEPASAPGGLPSEPDLRVEMPERLDVPAALGFPHRGNLVIETEPANRVAALRAVQSLIARILVSIPPSKVRFTFLDPVALGESFAAFMHLGDEFEQLVGERIWTEPRAIEQRLTDISEHMETVIQKYLRNEFADIDAYNDAAGEIAEPYRFLVCADFPANFSEQAATRMVSILRAGQRCGVHVILLRDRKTLLPDGIRAEDISESCLVVRGSGDGFTLVNSPLAGYALELDAPPPDERLIPLLARIGRAAKSAARVEVPFDAIAPKPDVFWSLSSAGGLKVPIGRAGATRLQQFALGEGTSQHALIAGKTGSGKSTLLHAIITGLATWYSPDEVELWLVDFKKGVEFKTYAEHALPHARAVAIESDREFGLSVLEGLDAELSRRGERFREAGVQDIASYRRANPSVRMPRVLLVIDEFQEFFLDDDRVAQGASMLLDRLVRQGRAFGMHALLGSQTLGGAYSLARSTMGQMGVRIALQCNEADSQLILSDENLAARLLSRPGEAIYNDAGGRPEGNSPFQVAFLPDAKRDIWLGEAERRASGRFDGLPRIVFEGDARAPMKLHAALKTGIKPDPRGSVRLWLGEAVSIKDPTCARLARAAGANVATISSRDEQSVATTASMLLSIAREAPDATIDVLDGTPADAPEHGLLERFCAEHALKVRFTPYREVEQRLLEIATDVTERSDDAGRARRFLVIQQLQRYRALRRNEDDFSFGASDGPPSPDKMLVGILKEGPQVGVHTVVACDTLASLQRTFDRNALREFDWKVLFQMSPADSSTLVDSPAASRLGNNRGLLHSEELGMLEKFRPYFF
jgi:DNA segregation ATPase FtsK/SpoIIIE, S-DNA-T family